MGKSFNRRRLLQGAAAGAVALQAPYVFAQSARVPVKFSLNLPRNGTNAPFILAHQGGYFAEAGIDITAMDPASGADAMMRVAANTYDISFADLTSLSELYAKAPNETPLGVFNVYKSTPASVVSWKSSGIAKPADLAGKTLGGPLTDNGFKLFPVFFRANGLDPATVKFNNVDLRLRESTLMRKEVDGVTGFDSTVWLNLKGLGVKEADVSIMRYSDWGLDLYSNSVIVSRKFLKDHEAAIPGVLRAVARAWVESIKATRPTIEALAKADPLVKAELEAERLEWVVKYQVATPEAKANGLGTIDRAKFEKSIKTMVDGFGLERTAPIDAVWTDKYLPAAELRKI